MTERFAAVLLIVILQFIVMVTALLWGFGLVPAVAAAAGIGAGAAEVAYRILGPGNGPGGSLTRIRPA